jgi:hypothetical protein
MSEVLGASPDQDPTYDLETLTGPEMDTHLLELWFQTVKVLPVSGFRIVCIDSRTVNPETHLVTVSCRDDELRNHQLTYTLDDDSPVAHEVLKDRPDPRTE